MNNSICGPSRATILTGQVDTRTGVMNNAQASNLNTEETVGPALQAAGYRTGIFGKLLNGYGAEPVIWPGWDDFQPIVSRNTYAQYNMNCSTTVSANTTEVTRRITPSTF